MNSMSIAKLYELNGTLSFMGKDNLRLCEESRPDEKSLVGMSSNSQNSISGL